MIRLWNSLTDEGQELVIMTGIILEAWLLFGLMV